MSILIGGLRAPAVASRVRFAENGIGAQATSGRHVESAENDTGGPAPGGTCVRRV